MALTFKRGRTKMSKWTDRHRFRLVWRWLPVILGLFFIVQFVSVRSTGKVYVPYPTRELTRFGLWLADFLPTNKGMVDQAASIRSRKIPQVIIRENQAAVLMTGVEEPAAKLYFIAKDSSGWQLKQKIDLADLLGGARCCFDNYEHRHKNDPILSIGMNENWFAFGISDSQDIEPSDLCAIIIFHKKDGRWAYHSTIDSRQSVDPDLSHITRVSHRLERTFVLTEDDELIVSYENYETDTANNIEGSPIYEMLLEREPALERVLKSNKRGISYVYKLKESAGPELIQTIAPPPLAQYALPGGMGLYSIAVGNYLFIHNYVPAPVVCGCAADALPWDDFAIYEKRNDQWEYKTSLLSLIPSEILRNESIPNLLYRYINAIEDGDNLFIYYHQDFYPVRALKLAVKNDSIEFVSFQSSDTRRHHSRNLQIPKQCVFDFDMKSSLKGAPPSSDDECHFIGTSCYLTVPDGDSIGIMGVPPARMPEGREIILLDDPRYQPLIRYSYSATGLITSYYYDGVYLDGKATMGWWLSRAWSGVDIYEVDPKTGPKKVFRMTTSHHRDLKEVPVSEEED